MTHTQHTAGPLEASIYDKLRSSGPMTFAEFMQLALYDPEHGYYRTSRSVVGTAGDFFTSVSATPMFGRLLARSMAFYAARVNAELPCEFHEFGAHRGQLQADILANAPEAVYRTYENNDTWPTRLEGFVIANELLDALPFHRLQVKDGRWVEQFVSVVDGRFDWVTGDVSREELLEPLDGLPLQYMEGYQTEVSLETRRWLETLAATLQRGLVFLFDYGHETENYFAPHRSEGGLRTFKQHQRGDDPFLDVGERDITCDVNFSDILTTAQRVGFDVVEFTDQGRFFSREVARILRGESLGPGETEGTRQRLSSTSFTPQEIRGLMTLTHPAHLGLAFKVVVLGKGLGLPVQEIG